MSLRVIGGTLRNRILKSPKGEQTRPTLAVLRKAVFDICQNEIADCHFLDLFAGSGAMGIEAISRGASQVIFVEQNRLALQCIRENLHHLGIEAAAEIMGFDVLSALKKLSKRERSFGIIYIDPPYAASLLQEALTYIGEHRLLSPCGTLFAEEAFPAHMDHTFPNLKHIDQRRFSHSLLHQFRASY